MDVDEGREMFLPMDADAGNGGVPLSSVVVRIIVFGWGAEGERRIGSILGDARTSNGANAEAVLGVLEADVVSTTPRSLVVVYVCRDESDGCSR